MKVGTEIMHTKHPNLSFSNILIVLFQQLFSSYDLKCSMIVNKY